MESRLKVLPLQLHLQVIFGKGSELSVVTIIINKKNSSFDE